MQFGKTIGLQLTLRCPFKCDNCLVNAGPERREEVPTPVALSWVSKIGRVGTIEVISITGGEPFVNQKRLEEITHLAKEYGLLVNVVTNAFWGKNYAQGTKLLKKLQGITHLSISTDIFHNKDIPLENVKNSCLAALDNGIEVALSICLKQNDDFIDILKSELGKELFEKLLIVPQHIHSVGRAKDLSLDEVKSPITKMPSVACGNLSMPFISYDGTIMACCGDAILKAELYPALKLGNMEQNSLRQILRKADRNYLIHALRLWGPAGLFQRITDRKLISRLKKSYSRDNICDLCCDLLSQVDIVNFFGEELSKAEVQREIALGRALKYGELSMLSISKSL